MLVATNVGINRSVVVSWMMMQSGLIVQTVTITVTCTMYSGFAVDSEAVDTRGAAGNKWTARV